MKTLIEGMGVASVVCLIIILLLLLTGNIRCNETAPKIDTLYVPVTDTVYVYHSDTIKADSIVYRYRVRVDSVPCLDGGRFDFVLPNGTASVAFSVDSGATIAINTADSIIHVDSMAIVQQEPNKRVSVSVGLMAGNSNIGPALAIHSEKFNIVTQYNMKNRSINFGLFVPLRIFVSP